MGAILAHQKMGPHHRLVLLHSSPEVNVDPFASTNANPHLSPRALFLASITGAKSKIFFKEVFLERWIFIGLERRKIKEEKLEVVLDL